MNAPRLLFSLSLLAGLARAAEVPAIVPQERRAASLAAAEKLVGPKDLALPPDLLNPFDSAAFAEVAGAAAGAASTAAAGTAEASRPTGPRSEHELLAAIASSLKPSGYFVIGGAHTLVFGEKRVKAGGTLSVEYNGTGYTLEITKIDRTHFTLRLNHEEYTRPIK